MQQLRYLLIASLTLGACTDQPDELGSGSQGVLVHNRIAANRIAANRIAANRIAANRIAANRIAANRFTANIGAMGDLLASPEGQELLAFLVGCALPEGTTLSATDPNGGPDLVFVGEVGVAPDWVDRPLDTTDRRWVSACILSRINVNDVSVEVSLRGPHAALATTAAERASHTLEEGAFYGNIFGPVDQPLQWYACRGRDQAAGESGGLADRDCAEPDPAHPGYTQCTVTDDLGNWVSAIRYAGDCADYAPPASPYACKDFVDGYYVDCATTSRPGHAGHDAGHGHHGHHGHHGLHDAGHHGHLKGHGDHSDDGDHDDDDDDDMGNPNKYGEVITTFLSP